MVTKRNFLLDIESGKIVKTNVLKYANYKDWYKIADKYLNIFFFFFSNFGLTYLYKFNVNYNARDGCWTGDNFF